ncbi:MAG: hypothetical protein AAGI71_19665 [Bacteroidota bacterium]
MYIFFDNLNAMIIGSAVILMLLSLQLRMTEINIEETANYMVKRQGADLATWMEDDLLTIGENLDATDTWFNDPVYALANGDSVTTSFTFMREQETPGGTVPVTTRYSLQPADTLVVDGVVTTAYRLVRDTSANGGAFVNGGASNALMSYFRLDLVNSDIKLVQNPSAVAAADPDSIWNVRVRFALVTPFETDQTTLHRVYYGSTLMLPMD